MSTLAKSSSANPVASAKSANLHHGSDAAAIDLASSFSQAIRALFARVRPRKIIETGTYLGTGSTLTLCEAAHQNAILLDQFFSIEVNPAFHEQARRNLAERGFFPNLLQGLSVPRALLPTPADIQRETLDSPPSQTIFIDHDPTRRVHYYHQETNFPGAPDDLLGKLLRGFHHAPDFLLLDSAGHMGFIEFQYALSLIWKPCCIALDDVYHIKHHRSLQLIQSDPRFRILELSHEKFGYCLTRFDPGIS